MLLEQGLDILLPKLTTTISKLSKFAEYKDLPCLGYTHGSQRSW
jgi:adenylosuccinate lyase